MILNRALTNIPTEKKLKKNGSGSMKTEQTAVIDNVKLSLVSWFDNKSVNMLSAYVGSEPKQQRNCIFEKKNNTRI